MTDFGGMDGQKVCQWLAVHGILDKQNTNQYNFDYWRIEVCAVEARNYVCCLSVGEMDQWVKSVEEFGQCPAATADMIDWLRAAAKVIEEQEKK